MSNTRRFNEKARKRRVTVEEVEEVVVVDRRGKVRAGLRRIPQDAPLPKTPSSNTRKKPRWKSPSPVAGGSKQHTKLSRTSKVCAMFIFVFQMLFISVCVRVKMISSESGFPSGILSYISSSI
jgi:hypothetical protein